MNKIIQNLKIKKEKQLKDYTQKPRFYFLDEIRGFCIICMIIYHALYDIEMIFKTYIPFMNSPLMNFIRDIFAGAFILISGISCNFSKNNLKRGSLCFLLGIGITIVTYIFVPLSPVIFGILHFIGVSIIIYSLTKNLINKINPKIGIPICLLSFIITNRIASGYIGIKGILSFNIPQNLNNNQLLFILGVHSNNFSSVDYFPIIPWIFIFFLGIFLGTYLNSDNINPKLYKKRCFLLGVVGRNTLIIYILHQPIIYSTFYIISKIIS